MKRTFTYQTGQPTVALLMTAIATTSGLDDAAAG